MSAVSNSEYRLPTTLKPTHYDLTVRTDLEKLKFDGFVEVSLDVKESTDIVAFNTADLTLSSISVSSSQNETYVHPASGLVIDKATERATLKLPFVLSQGAAVRLRIQFEGDINETRKGYFRNTHKHNDGQTTYYAVTQFAPTAARSGFPCWDEPALKATFAATLISRTGTVNLNNMPAVFEAEYDPMLTPASVTERWLSERLVGTSEKWKITRFQTTPPMSTYIVAYSNGPFEYLEGSYKSPLSGKVRPLRLYATSDLIDQAEFVMSVKERVLPLYEKVFDIEYPLPKLDTLVASDFESGAMENWGLIMGAPRVLLVDPKTADVPSKKMVASVESHEIAHMWFGNITTTTWWDNLYLNEGFASLMGEVIILDKVFPEFQVHAKFISYHLNSALSLDAKLSSHPIEVECPDANMINQIFDALSYSKAASVMRMLSDYVGEEKFLKGVSIYLKDHLYGNTVTEDLWKGIQTATGLDIPRIMNAWVKEMGFPVITVTETNDGIHVRQDRFLESGPALPKDNETIWTIPLFLVTAGLDGKPIVDRSVVLDSREKIIPFDTSKHFKFNAGTVGVYRVLYTPERLAAIAKEAAKPQGSLYTFEDRIGLINDSPALAKAGLVQLSSTLTLIDNFRNETEFLVWSSIADCLGTIASTWWEHQNIVDYLDEFRRELFVPIVKRLGFEYSGDEDVSIKELRTKAIMQAAESKDASVIEELRDRFDHLLKTGDNSRIPADLLNITYKVAGQYGGQAEWDLFASSYSSSSTATVRRASMIGLGAFQEDKYIDQTFAFMETKAKDQDLVHFFMALASNFKYRRYSTRKFKESFDAYFKRVETLFTLQYAIQIPFEVLTTREDHKESEEFFKTKDTSKFDMTLQQTLDTINSKVLWIERSTSDLLGWLESRQRST